VASSLRMAGSVMTTTTTTKDDNEVVRLYDEAGENASESTRTRFGVRRYLSSATIGRQADSRSGRLKLSDSCAQSDSAATVLIFKHGIYSFPAYTFQKYLKLLVRSGLEFGKPVVLLDIAVDRVRDGCLDGRSGQKWIGGEPIGESQPIMVQ
jgi:hypothetical protein